MLHFQPPATLLLPCFPSPLNGYGSYDVSNLDEIDLLHLFLLTSVQEQIQLVYQWLQPHFFSMFETTVSELTSLYRPLSSSDPSNQGTFMVNTTQHLGSEKHNLLTELMYFCLKFAHSHLFSIQSTRMMVTLLMWLHHHVSTTMTTTFQQDYGTFKSWLLSCTVPQPLKAPMPEDPFPIFTYAQSKEIHTYFLTTYFRHYHLYKYVFGPNPLPLEASFLGTRPPSSSSSSSTAVTAAMVALNGSEDGLAGGVEGLMMMMTPMGLAGGSEGGGTGAVGGEEKGMVGNSS